MPEASAASPPHVGAYKRLLNLLPTLTALAGVLRVGDLPLDGRDLSPLLLGMIAHWPERIIFNTWAGQVSARVFQKEMARGIRRSH